MQPNPIAHEHHVGPYAVCGLLWRPAAHDAMPCKRCEARREAWRKAAEKLRRKGP